MPDHLRDLLLADLTHFSESVWKNEETGEKRFEFFLTIVTAVLAALIALATSDEESVRKWRAAQPHLVGLANLALLVFGVLTYLRMMQRDKTTKEYKDTVAYIRGRYVNGLTDKPEPYEVPLGRLKEADAPKWALTGRRPVRILGKYTLPPFDLRKLLRGGFAQTTGAVNGVLLASTLVTARVMTLKAASIWGTVFAGALMLWACRVHKFNGPSC